MWGEEATVMLAGRYRLVRRVATGGMGTIHDAVDVRLGRRVAVKILKPEYADDPRFVERFTREARAAAGLTHPHIAQVFDSGHDAGQYFIVMEYVDGDDLGRMLSQQTRLAPARAARIAAQVCSALAAAHTVGIVHRDVKPGNVLLAPGDQVKLTDFGIAQTQGQAALTGTGLVLGTADYLSPEQAAGQTATPASDIYSAGIVLFEMLTGAVPFVGASPVAVAHDHLTRPVPPVRDPAPDVPPRLAAVVERATAKDPNRRFPDAAAMEAELRHGLEATRERAPTAMLPAPTRALAPPAAGGRHQRHRQPHRLAAAAAGVMVVAALIVGGLLLANNPSSPQQAEAANPSGPATTGPAASARDAPTRDNSDHPHRTAGDDPTKRHKPKKGPPDHPGNHYGKGHKPDHKPGHDH